MLLFVELSVDARKGKLAKDGLYQYKNTAQNTNIGTIELVFKKFIELAEAKVTEAQGRADEVQSSLDATSGIDDLEASETPESILLSTVSGEQSKDRTDRAIVTPWLKFLWETYRTVLEIFKNNARLEVMYQSTAHQAFAFCSRYARKTEFRRLCELLRNHLQNAAKFSNQMHAINLSEPETLQRQLDTRFQQLNVAVELELWQEAFRSVEDIHTLLTLSKRPAKNIMMANYFEKLTRIFLVSENYLFHAASWSRYYNLLRQSANAVASGATPKKDNPAVTEADMTKAASFVVLSALAIPVISTSRSRGALVDADEARKGKNTRLTSLLGMNQSPTRAILFKDALSKGLLKRCKPEIRELYNILEVDFHPLSICKKISPILSAIGADEEMKQYVQPLQQVILTRLFQQLSQVYESVELKFVLNLAQFPEPFQVTPDYIEKFIMNGCKKGDLAIRVDHAAGVLTFDNDVFSSAKASGSGAGSAEAPAGSVQRLQSTPAEIVRSQLTRLSKALFITCQYVDPAFNSDRYDLKQAALARAEAGAEKEHVDILARREVIEKKKQAASSALAQKEKDLAQQKRLKLQEAAAAESQRLADEQRERDRRRLEAEKAKVQQEEAQRALDELKRGTKGINLDEIDVTQLDSTGIRQIKVKAMEKELQDKSEKLRLTWRRVDHLERAYRREELKHIPEDYAAQREADLQAYNQTKEDTLVESKIKHEHDLALKNRLERLVPVYEDFRKRIQHDRRADFEKRKKKAQQELEAKMEARKQQYIAEKVAQRQREEEEAERVREEEERLESEAAAKAEEDEKKRAHLAELKAQREAERAKLDEVAAKQRQREQEAEERRTAQRTAGLGPRGSNRDIPIRAAAEPAAVTAGGPPKLNIARKDGTAPTWRERQAQKAAAGGGDALDDAPVRTASPAAPSAPTEDAPKRTGYVPPAARAAGGAGGWRGGERESTSRGPAVARGLGMEERSFSGRGRDSDRGESPAPSKLGGSGYKPPHMREGRPLPRAEEANEDRETSRPPPPAAGATAGGKYVPGAFRKTQG